MRWREFRAPSAGGRARVWIPPLTPNSANHQQIPKIIDSENPKRFLREEQFVFFFSNCNFKKIVLLKKLKELPCCPASLGWLPLWGSGHQKQFVFLKI